MSKDSCVVELGGFEFKVTGTVSSHDRPPVEDLTVKAVFTDLYEQVLVEVPNEFLTELFVQEGVVLPGTAPRYWPLEDFFVRKLIASTEARLLDEATDAGR